MLFETSGVWVEPWIPPLVALVISFFTSMGGVSGAFLLLPFQVSVLGYTQPSVSATNQLFNIVAIPSGVYRYWREGRMAWPLTFVVVGGTLPGVFLGAFVRVAHLPDPRHFKLFAAAVLLYLGARMVRALVARRRAEPSDETPPASEPAPGETLVTHFGLTELRYTYAGEELVVPVWPVLGLSFVVGIVGGIYGIGGGAIMAPFLVSVFRLPVHTVAGPALMGTFVTSIAGVAFYSGIAPLYPGRSVAPDWLLGAAFGVGGMLGMYLGARVQRFVPAAVIQGMLAAIILLTAAKYVLEFFA